jgi:predicted DNA-binding protein (UPF0251 family)
MKRKFYRFFLRSNKNYRGEIDRDFKSSYFLFIDFTYALTGNFEESEKIVDNVLDMAVSGKIKPYRRESLTEFIFRELDAAITDYNEEKMLRKKISDLMYGKKKIGKGISTEQLITLEVIRAFHEEVENLPRQRQNIFRLFFCGSDTSDVAEKVGISKQTVLNQKNNAIKDIRKALIRRGLIFIDGMEC